jgi:RNA polymerase sigma factor (sigma-70 family)
MLASLNEDLEKMTLPQSGLFQRRKDDEEEKKRLLARLNALMDSMGEKCREILVLRDREGESYINLAKRLKIPPGTVMSQLARCRKALRHLMQNELKEAKS